MIRFPDRSVAGLGIDRPLRAPGFLEGAHEGIHGNMLAFRAKSNRGEKGLHGRGMKPRVFRAPLARDAPDGRAQLGEFFFDAFVAAINVVDAIHDRIALGHQSGQHEAGRSA